jgi:hypothetical protein
MMVSGLGYRRVEADKVIDPELERRASCVEPIHASEPPLRTRSLCDRKKIEFMDAPERTNYRGGKENGTGYFLLIRLAPAMLEAVLPGIPRGQQTGLGHNTRGNGRAEVSHKSEHYVFDAKVRTFWRGYEKTGRKRLASP